MPAHNRCVGLYAIEAPDVIFESVLRFTLPSFTRHHFLNLDPLYVSAVEVETLRIAAVTCSLPIPVRAKLESSIQYQAASIQLDLPSQPHAVTLCITVQAIRRGMQSRRWQPFTRAQLEANHRFYRHAWNREHA